MVSEEILGGLKAALNRGESLRQAMMSFYNAGYKKEEIEEAAKALQIEQQQSPLQPSQTQPVQQIKPKPKGIPSQPTKAVQRVSNYEQFKSKGTWLLFLMIFILLVLLGILAGIFFFRSELIDFFGKWF